MAISDESRDAYWNKGAYSKEARINKKRKGTCRRTCRLWILPG